MSHEAPGALAQRGSDDASPVAFDTFARNATRRHVVPPLLLSLAIAAALVASLLQAARTLAENPATGLPALTDRFLGNEFSLAIIVVFLTSLVYGALQLAGILVDRRRLPLLGLSGGQAQARWPALVTGRPSRARPGDTTLRDEPAPGDPREAADRYRFHLDHQAELGLLPLRFCVWVLPLLGFIGTVVGIARSITGLRTVITPGTGAQSAEGLSIVLGGLQFAFDTTLLGLVFVIPVMLLQMVLRGRESEMAEEARHAVLTVLTSHGTDERAPTVPPDEAAG